MAKVILDPGHGGRDIGDYYMNRSEKNDTLSLALRVGLFLEAQGISVVYIRKTDVYLSIMERIKLINEADADLMISLHRLNEMDYSSKPGLDFFLKEDDIKVKDAAITIGKELYSVGYTTYGLIIRTDLPLLNEVSIPAFMLGIGYIGKEQENLFYDHNIMTIAEAIAKGILEYLTNTIDNETDLIRKQMSLGYRYRVIAGKYYSYDEAVEKQMLLRNHGVQAEIEYGFQKYFVCTGLLEQLDDAVLLEVQLRRLGYRTMIIIV